MDSFYVVLPSNAPVEGNMSSNFTVRLPETLDLDNNWTVGLSSLTFNHSFPTIGAEKDQYIDLYFDEHRYIRVPIGPLVILTKEELEQTINDAIVERLKEVKAIKNPARVKRDQAPLLSQADKQKLAAARRAVYKSLEDAKKVNNFGDEYKTLTEDLREKIRDMKQRYPGIASDKI